MEIPARLMPARLRFIAFVIACIFAGITARLVYLQIFHTITFVDLSQKNFLRYEKVIPLRGTLFDINGTMLATNRPVLSLYWQGTGNRTLTVEQQETLALLEALIAPEIIDRTAILLTEKLCRPLRILRDISYDLLSKISEQFAENPNCTIVTEFQRFYPHGSLACHAVGYLGLHDAEREGKMGLERILENTLHGISGKKETMINSWGRFLREQETHTPQAGKNIVLTIDRDWQQIAEEVFPLGSSGAIIAMDAGDGALKILMSRPAFDPNIFLEPLSEETWRDLQKSNPFVNRAVVACYPPASLFKLITVAAGLETGIVSYDSGFYCPGYLEFCGRKYHCHKLEGHGYLPLGEGVAHSCNIPFYEIGKRIKIDTLAHYAHIFGLGVPTGSIFAERSGLVPTSSWKKKIKGERWWPGETLSTAIGQSYLLVTPLQTVRMINAICHGYLVRPRITVDEPIERSALAIAPTTREFLKQCMRSSVRQGTSSSLKSIKSEIYAKTGTAQPSSIEKKEASGGTELLEHAWLVAYIQYKEFPPFTLGITIENAGSSRVAVAVAKQFIKKLFTLLDQRAEHQSEETKA